MVTGNSIYCSIYTCRDYILNILCAKMLYTCKRAYGLGSQCHPNECLFGSGKTPGGRDFGWGARWAGEGNKGVSLLATRERGGRILSQQGGFQVSGKGH